MQNRKAPTFADRRQQISTVEDIDIQLARAKAYVAQIKRDIKAASTLSDKEHLATYLKEAERTLHQLRMASFDIEDELRAS